jgi:L-ribulose-5-phosphate 4-epimerase
MTIKTLQERVLEANLNLVKHNLVVLTWGNVSGYDSETGLFAIKASGVSYDEMKAEHMTVLDLDGKVVEGKYKPSSDTPTHLVLYKEYKDKGVHGVVHTHSSFATMWAQSGFDVPILGTTHADYFGGDIPVSRMLTKEEIQNEYEKNTGLVIVETFRKRNLDTKSMSAVLVHSHGPFVWGKSPEEAVEHSIVLEYVSKMAFCNVALDGAVKTGPIHRIQKELAEKHYNRKFGPGAYYGQK